MRRSLAISLAAVLFVSACGDDAPFGGSDTSAPTSSEAPTSTVPPPTTEAATTTAATTPATTAATTASTTIATTTTTTAPLPERTASDALAGIGFYTLVEDLDLYIAETAVLFNEQWDPDAGTLGAGARNAVLSLDASYLRDYIPPGLPPEVEVAVLAVYADLDSRIAAMHGAVGSLSNTDEVRRCLGYGGESFQRVDDDLGSLYDIARAAPAPPEYAADSREAGILAVRLEVIRLANWGCDGCGGAVYGATSPVDWEGRTVFGVEFEAEFTNGRWVIWMQTC